MIEPGDHILSARMFSREDLARLGGLARALEPVARGEMLCDALAGAVLVNLFFEPSTRTRISFGTAFARLGGHVLETAGIGSTAIVKGESLADTARVVSGYADVVVMRHSASAAAARFAEAALIPVVNAGDGDGEHPTQALTDWLTIEKELAGHGRAIDGSRIAIVGDLRYGRTTHSLLALLSLFEGMRFALVSPPALRMPADYVAIARGRGHEVIEADDLERGLDGADIVYMTRYQSERFAMDPESRDAAQRLRLDPDSFRRHAPAHAAILHPLPRDASFDELSTALDPLPNLAIFRQADNGVAMRMALFAAIFGIGGDIAGRLAPAPWPLRRRAAPAARAAPDAGDPA